MMGRKIFLILLSLTLVGAGDAPEEKTKPAKTGAKKSLSLKNRMPRFSLLGPTWFWKALELSSPTLTPGRWVEYVTEKPYAHPVRVRISIIPEPDLPSPDHRVVELRQIDPTGTRTYIKALLAPESDNKASLLALQFKSGDMPTMNFPIGADEKASEVELESDIQGLTQIVFEKEGEETLETEAGTFQTRIYKAAGLKGKGAVETIAEAKKAAPKTGPGGKPLTTRVWAANKNTVPLLGIVRMSDGVVTHTLAAQGDDARADLPDIGPLVAANKKRHEHQ